MCTVRTVYSLQCVQCSLVSQSDQWFIVPCCWCVLLCCCVVRTAASMRRVVHCSMRQLPDQPAVTLQMESTVTATQLNTIVLQRVYQCVLHHCHCHPVKYIWHTFSLFSSVLQCSLPLWSVATQLQCGGSDIQWDIVQALGGCCHYRDASE